MHDLAPQRPEAEIEPEEPAGLHELHAAICREKGEPRAGAEALSPWLVALYCLVIFSAGFNLGRYSGGFAADSLDPMESSQVVDGWE